MPDRYVSTVEMSTKWVSIPMTIWMAWMLFSLPENSGMKMTKSKELVQKNCFISSLTVSIMLSQQKSWLKPHPELHSLNLLAPTVMCIILMFSNILHVSLVVVANFLDANVVLWLDVGLCGGIGPSQSHHANDVLKILLVFNFDLRERLHSLVSS